MDNNDSRAILNGINLRLNDIDLKLSFVLELLTNRLPEKRSREQLTALQLSHTQLRETTIDRRSISTAELKEQRQSLERTSALATENVVNEIASGNTAPSVHLDRNEKSVQRQHDDLLSETSYVSKKGRSAATSGGALNDSEGDEEEVDDYDDELDEVFRTALYKFLLVSAWLNKLYC